MAKTPYVAEVPNWEAHLRQPVPISPVKQILDKSIAQATDSEQIQLLKEIRNYLKYQIQHNYYLQFPSSSARIRTHSTWINYDASGASFSTRIAQYFRILVDLQFMAAIEDAAGIQGGVPIQCEPYELMGYVRFYFLLNGTSPFLADYGYQTGANVQSVGGFGMLAKNYALSEGVQPVYSKEGDIINIGYNVLSAPLRTISKIGFMVKWLIVDKIVLQDIGIVRI